MFERMTTPALKAGGRIADLDAQDYAHPNAVRPFAQKISPTAPPRIKLAARHIARADDDIARVHLRGESREIIRRVGKVRIHLDDTIRALFHRPAKPGDVRGSQSHFARAMDDAHAFGMTFL